MEKLKQQNAQEKNLNRFLAAEKALLDPETSKKA